MSFVDEDEVGSVHYCRENDEYDACGGDVCVSVHIAENENSYCSE